MAVTYKNNRLVPAVLIATCVLLFFWLVDPSVQNYGQSVPELVTEKPTGDPYYEGSTSSSHYTEPEPAAPRVQTSQDATGGSLTGDDVLLIMKTGGTTMWKRLLIHLPTTLAGERINPANTVIYSDYAESVGGFDIVDVFANVTDEVRDSFDFDVYRQQPEYVANNYYAEVAGVNGDEWGPTGGWIIDKYKFVPLMQHAGDNWPEAKWYVYMEDDAYLFLPNVLAYLATFDWREPHYLGHYSAKSDVVFAHGGAGFALSRGAWEASFGRSEHLAEDWHAYTADHCCGDQVLAAALHDHGVNFGENGGDGKFTWGFNPVVHWSFAFSKYNWCSPLLSWHKVHSRDVARYYELERSWDFAKGPLLHRDFFSKMILPHVQDRMEWWDNTASLYEVTSANKAAPPEPESRHSSNLWKTAWASVVACEAACRSWVDCVQWTYVEDLCRMDDKLVMGQGYAPAMSQRKTSLKHTSGWVPERLEQWTC